MFWYYFARIYKDGDRSNRPARSMYLDGNISYSSIEFNGLEACTIYELSISGSNRDVSIPPNAFYAVGVTEVTCKCQIVQRYYFLESPSWRHIVLFCERIPSK